MFDVEANNKNIIVYKLSVLMIKTTIVPFFFLLQFFFYNFLWVLIVFLLIHVIYFFLWSRIKLQLKLFILFQNHWIKLWIKFISPLDFLVNLASFSLFLFFFSLLFYYSSSHLFCYVLFFFFKFFLVFVIFPKKFYTSLFFCLEFSNYLIELKKNYSEDLEILNLLNNLRFLLIDD